MACSSLEEEEKKEEKLLWNMICNFFVCLSKYYSLMGVPKETEIRLFWEVPLRNNNGLSEAFWPFPFSILDVFLKSSYPNPPVK